MQENLTQRCLKAESPSTSPEVLRLLARDKDPGVRCAVARNPSTLPPTLSFLATDMEEEVRLAVAGNPHTMALTRVMLAADRSARVRLAAAGSSAARPGAALPPSVREPEAGTLLRFDSNRGELVEVPVKLNPEIRRYVQKHWRRTGRAEDDPSGKRGLGS